jgi:hypothetical protein
MDMYQLKYPIGEYQKEDWINRIEECKQIIADLPQNLDEILPQLEGKRQKSYRPGGWNAIQIIHHMADSHMNAYIRFKLCLTEDTPIIKPYLENEWAALPDGNDPDLTYTLLLLKGLHGRWYKCLQAIKEEDYDRQFFHPESKRLVSIKEMFGLYAWHCSQHLAHLRLIAAAD